MKTISPALADHLKGCVTTLATLVKITRKDGVVKGFTTHDADITIDDTTYRAQSALTPSAIESRSGLAVDNLEVTGVLDNAELSDADIASGLYDFARVDVFVCNWKDPSQGTVQLRRGWVGRITRSGDSYAAELRGMHDLLQRPVGEYYTPECRFDFGDQRCAIDLEARTVTGAVSNAIDRAAFSDLAQTAAPFVFDYGHIVWISGNNQGLSVEIKSWDAVTKTFTLWLPMPFAIKTGDLFKAAPGCDKRLSTCRDVFSNCANFGGFPYVPGVANILKYPS